MNHIQPRRSATVEGRPGASHLRYRPAWAAARMASRGALALATLVLVVLVGADAAHAAEPGTVVLAAESIDQVVNNIRTWLVGILVGVATLFLTVGGLRYLAANGDPGEVEKAKTALRSAALGYALALLAPLFVTIVGQWVA
jgi:hypothetical protein